MGVCDLWPEHSFCCVVLLLVLFLATKLLATTGLLSAKLRDFAIADNEERSCLFFHSKGAETSA
jgi:hypothetical protein